MRYKLVVSYDGACFNGWQKQIIGPPTVQGTLEQILATMLSTPTRVVGSGRTDTGVHAVAQVAHFNSDLILSDRRGFIRSMNALAPDGLIIKSAWTAPDDFHAVASAVSKTYIYRIWNAPLPSIFHRHWALHVPKPLDLAKLNEVCSILQGEMDFKSFQTRGTPVKTTVRVIEEARWQRKSGRLIEFRISGNGFLKQMVRNIVGTLLYLDRKNQGQNELSAILEAKDRQAAKATAPSHGLYMLQVKYPARLDNQCRKL
jgi:tRNA pseudouridine38-40 synthase